MIPVLLSPELWDAPDQTMINDKACGAWTPSYDCSGYRRCMPQRERERALLNLWTPLGVIGKRLHRAANRVGILRKRARANLSFCDLLRTFREYTSEVAASACLWYPMRHREAARSAHSPRSCRVTTSAQRECCVCRGRSAAVAELKSGSFRLKQSASPREHDFHLPKRKAIVV